MVLGRPNLKPLDDSVVNDFQNASIANIGLESCAGCDLADSCENVEWPFTVEMSHSLLGTVKPYRRIVVCSTGKSDWPHDVSGEKGSLASYISKAYSDRKPDAHNHKHSHSLSTSTSFVGKFFGSKESEVSKSIFNSPDLQKLTILNGSNLSADHDTDSHSVLVFPDYKIVHAVKSSQSSANTLVEKHLHPDLHAWTSTPLPYIATILICSHKRRDKRCHLSAPILIDEVARCCAAEGWEIDERGDFDTDEDATPEITREEFEQRLNNISSSSCPTVGVFKVSHVGGHKYAGNMVVCLPNGANVWYGRVTKREVPAIIQNTIKEGKIIRELLRGAGNVGGKQDSILQW